MKNWAKKCEMRVKKFWKENRFLVKPLLVILVIYLVGLSALILAGVHYADDVARTNYGYAGWAGFSRYISTVASHFLHADWYLTNIAPWPQILAVVILAIASILFIIVIAGKDIFKKKWTKWIWLVAAVIPLVLSPYMLECLSYQYDAPYMALSVLFAILPLMFWKNKKWVYAVMIVVGVLVICMTYQASIGIFPMLVILVAIREWDKGKMSNKEIIKFVIFSITMFLLAVVVFQKVLMRPREAYASNSLPELGEFFPVLFAHLKQYFELVVSDFRILWKALIVIIAVLFVGIFVARSQKNKVVAGVISIIGLILMALATLVLYAALESPLYAPRAMYAVGAFVAAMSVYIMSGKYSNCVTKIPVAVLGYCFVMFALTYGNALREQNDFRNSRVDMVINDLNDLSVMKNGESKMIQVDGEIGLAPVIRHMPMEDYRVLYRLMMPTFSDNVPWMEYRITQGGWFDNLYYQPEVDLEEKNLPLLKDTALYKIYGDRDGILVEFKNTVRYDLLF